MNRKDTNPRVKTVFSLSALTLLITGAVLYAGPLNPPSGPITSTYKALTEVEPRVAINATNTPGDATNLFIITQSGSYYFATNQTGQSGKHGIKLAAPNVTIDLNGFTFTGGTGTLNAFTASGASNVNVTVRNGKVRNWGNGGVHLVDQGGTRSIVENIQAENNGWDGIVVGRDSIVNSCIAEGNGQAGIRTGTGGMVKDCVASYNTEAGIDLGISSRAVDCAVTDNSLQGIVTNTNCALSGITAYSNTGIGIQVGADSTVTTCASYSNSSSGITANTGCLIKDCASTDNSGNGIAVSNGSRVESCVTRSNDSNGISAASGCSIINNTCSVNGQGILGGAGILINAGDNRIEGNSCITQDTGINVNAAGNIIIRNTCAGNTTNWDIVANNYYGVIISRVGVGTASVTGNAAVATLGSTDPNANFSY